MGGRAETLAELTQIILAVVRPHPVRVAGRRIRRTRPRATTWTPGTTRRSATGCWVPLGPGGSRRYRTAMMDPPARTAIDAPDEVAPDDAVLIADGAFLQRPELDAHWDLRIYVDVGFDTVLRRGIVRDRQWMGSAADAERRYRTKYIPGERRYVDEVRPRERADVVVNNEDPAAPIIVRRSLPV